METTSEPAFASLIASEPTCSPEISFGRYLRFCASLPLRRQRENALLYVRGLVEQGGRKSLQPTLFRLGETPARYESVQQLKGSLSQRACPDPAAFERANYMKALKSYTSRFA